MTGKTGDYYSGRSEDSSTGVDSSLAVKSERRGIEATIPNILLFGIVNHNSARVVKPPVSHGFQELV
jgi:hypothetical protein